MIIIFFLCQLISIVASVIDKKIYIIEGEDYRVNLDYIFDEMNEYSFQSQTKGFTLDNSNMKLISDKGKYKTLPTKLLRERQLINLEDYQGLGQFGILDQYDKGHRICYNSDAIITLDQCIELDNAATSYDFVFIDKNTIAASKIRAEDQLYGVTIYQNKEIIGELYFVPSIIYTQVDKTIIEYCIFDEKKYLLFGVTEEDSNIEFLEILDTFNSQISNMKKIIDKSLTQKQKFQVYDLRGSVDQVYVVLKSSQQEKQINKFRFFQNQWYLQETQLSLEFRGFELGYSFINQSVTSTHLQCQEDSYQIISNKGSRISQNFTQLIKPDSQVRYTLNYLIVLQDNVILITTLQHSPQRRSIVEGTLLKIDVDFQNDVLFVFTNTKIMTYRLKQPALSYESHKITTNLDIVTIEAKSSQNQQTANIPFQVLSKSDYNLYLLKDLNQDLFYNQEFYSHKFSLPLYGISGADINAEGIVYSKVDNKVNEINRNYPQLIIQIWIRKQSYSLKNYNF